MERRFPALLAVYVCLVLGYAPAWGERQAIGARLILLAWGGLMAVVLAERFRWRWEIIPLAIGTVLVGLTPPDGYRNDGLWVAGVVLGWVWFEGHDRLPARVRTLLSHPSSLAALAGLGLGVVGQVAKRPEAMSTAVCGGAIAVLALAGAHRLRRPMLLVLAGVTLQTVWSSWTHASQMGFAANGVDQVNANYAAPMSWLWAAAMVLAATFLVEPFLSDSGRRAWLRGGLLVAVAVSLKVLALWTWISPNADYAVCCRRACETLSVGANPYGHVWYLEGMKPPRGVEWVPGQEYAFCYPPGLILELFPFWRFLGDFRYAYVACDLLVVGLWLWMARGTMVWMLVAMYLFSPQSTYMLTRGWTEPPLLVWLSLTVALWGRRGMAAALGMALATKQSALAMVLAAWRHLREKPPRVACMTGVAALVCLPFVALDAGEFIRQTTLVLRFPARWDALNAANWLADCLPGLWLPYWSSGLSLVLVMGLVALQGSSRFQYALGVTAITLTMYLFGKQAFLNYYWFLGSALLLTILVCHADDGPPTPASQGDS